jgi:AcrR family transcriptional regulator
MATQIEKVRKMNSYKKPLQPRALETERRFLDALNTLLKSKSLAQLSIDEIAETAGLERGAFLKRFGSKKQALLILWGQYSDRACATADMCEKQLPTFNNAVDACMYISKQIERVQTADFSSNRAMHEDFLERLTVNSVTKKIFMACVNLMRQVQLQFLDSKSSTDQGAFAAAQLIITINYNYVLKAMPGLPVNDEDRHRLIGEIVASSLKR